MDIEAAGLGQHWAGLHSFAWMRYQRHIKWWIVCCCWWGSVELQGQTAYSVVWHPAGEDTLPMLRGRALRSSFRDQVECEAWLQGLITELQQTGRLEASLDSFHFFSAEVHVWLHTGPVYVWSAFEWPKELRPWLEAGGWDFRPMPGQAVDFSALRRCTERWLSWMDDNGYPFASVALDSLRTSVGVLHGSLRVETGPLYHIDSLVVTGAVAIRRNYLERYLGIAAGSLYRKDRLEQIDRRLAELGFLQAAAPWSLTMVGTGATLNLFLESRKVSQVNVLAGLMPDNVQTGGKLLLTGEAYADLRNAFGMGERLMANWQQIQYRSPRLRISYQQPYLFGSALGLDLQLDLLRKDSSYLTIQAGAGLQFLNTARQSGRIGYQLLSTRLLDVDTLWIRERRALPDFNDAVNHLVDLEYRYVGTDDRLRPRRGLEGMVSAAAGLRRVRPHPSVVSLSKDAAGRPFDFGALYETMGRGRPVGRLRAMASQFLPIGRQSVFRLGVQAGVVFSGEVFRNEVFQVGGLRTLRGFDEESLFASQYGILTAEYRLLTGGRSYFYAFADAGRVHCKAWQSDSRADCLGVGLGLVLETRAGLLNLAYALGKRDGLATDPRQAKIHIGLTGLF